MAKLVLDVGNCSVDHAMLRRLLRTQFPGVELLQAHDSEDTVEQLEQENVDLVLINRKLDRDYTDGLEIIKKLKADPDLRKVPVMLLSNYPEHQALAVAAGAEGGFGKLEYELPSTLDKLRRFLGE